MAYGLSAAGDPARNAAGACKGRSGPEGRARADASEDGWYGCACEAHARGGATRARARVSPDGVHVRQAVACRLLAARTRAASTACGILRHGLGLALTMRERQGAARKRHALSRIRKTARHRPVSIPAPAAGRRGPAQGTWLLRWLAWRSHPDGISRAASGPCRGTASLSASPHVTETPKGPSSRRVRNVREPSGSGSTDSMTPGGRVWMKLVWRYRQTIANAGSGAAICPPFRAIWRGHRSPAEGES